MKFLTFLFYQGTEIITFEHELIKLSKNGQNQWKEGKILIQNDFFYLVYLHLKPCFLLKVNIFYFKKYQKF